MNTGMIEGYVIARSAAGLSSGTIKLHAYYLHRFANAHPDFARVTTRELEAFLATPGWSPETRKSARAAVRGFYSWASRSGLVAVNPAAELEPVRIPRAVARPAPETVVHELITLPGRVGVMAMLAAYCGLRRAEIAAVHTRDLVGDRLRILGKGGKVRVVPVAAPALLLAIHDADGWVFPSPYGGHLTPDHVGRLLSRAMPEGWTAHTLRHRMATVSYAATRDVLCLGAVLGHSQPETTLRYVLLPDDGLRAIVAAATAA